MLLDELVAAIETLQQRIVQYKDELGSSEALTRYVLINPLLRALGWNLEDPAQVRPEYGGVGGGLADYALFGDGAAGKPAVILEAKSLDTVLSSTVVNQAFQYCFQLGIVHMVITDGNRWRCFDLLTPGLAIREREIKSITLTAEPAYKLALQLLLLWRPNLASGEPVAASEPVLSTEQATPDSQSTNTQQPATDAPPSPSDEGWTSLAELQNVTGRPPPSVIRLPDGAEKNITRWWEVPFRVAEWHVSTGKLISDACPIWSGRSKYIVNTDPQHSNGSAFNQPRRLANGLFVDTPYDAEGLLKSAKSLLWHFGKDAAEVWVKLD